MQLKLDWEKGAYTKVCYFSGHHFEAVIVACNFIFRVSKFGKLVIFRILLEKDLQSTTSTREKFGNQPGLDKSTSCS